MNRPDIVILHPPSVYDFRQEPKLYGPISEVVPSTPLFEMYPLGFATIAGYLQSRGYRARIVNLALRMIKDPSFSAERFIGKLRPKVFGVGLQWLCHSHGAVEVARLAKRLHPDVPVILGGLSASYYHEQLMEYPEIDYVLRGDSTEAPLVELLQSLEEGRPPAEVPNLTWRDHAGNVRVNPLSYVPESVGLRPLDHATMVRAVLRDRDLVSNMPFRDWLEYPMGVGITCRGCTHNCVTCGGSEYAFRHFFGRKEPAFRPPDALAEDLKSIRGFGKGLMMVIGDVRQEGMGYARRFLQAMGRMNDPITLELFTPAGDGFMLQVSDALPNFSLEISVESHDEEVRRAFGKYYSNRAVERTIESAFSAGCQRLDIYFMIGLPKQTRGSVMDTVAYCGELLDRYRDDGRLHLFVSPLAPFLDPGSIAFEEPDRHGYTIFHRSLEDHRRALLNPSWKYVLNYETDWMTREDIVLSSYEAILELNRIKLRHGLISPREVAQTEERTAQALELLEVLDTVGPTDAVQLEELKLRLEKANGIFARPGNDWEAGLRLGKWGLLRQCLYLLGQGLAAMVSAVWSAVGGYDRERPSRVRGMSTSGE